jgi:hypothetical protein
VLVIKKDTKTSTDVNTTNQQILHVYAPISSFWILLSTPYKNHNSLQLGKTNMHNCELPNYPRHSCARTNKNKEYISRKTDRKGIEKAKNYDRSQQTPGKKIIIPFVHTQSLND